jgi:hypothetical protein
MSINFTKCLLSKVLVVDTNDILNCTHEDGPIEPIQV